MFSLFVLVMMLDTADSDENEHSILDENFLSMRLKCSENVKVSTTSVCTL